MARFCIAVVAVLGLAITLGATPGLAQGTAAAPAASAPDVRGHVVDKKKVAECRAKAKDQKLRYGKRRKFMRTCVEG